MGARAFAVTVLIGLYATSAGAQTPAAPLPSRAIQLPVSALHAESPAQQLEALRRWTTDYAEWRAWFVKWRNRPEPGFFTSMRPRRAAPDPPAWLADACAGRRLDAGPLVEACRAFDDWRNGSDPAHLLTQQIAQSHATLETPSKTLWWERIHVDGLWPMTQSGSNALGVAGMHTTMHLGERLQVFLAPGVIMMRIPSLEGRMTWSAAADWGFSYRLTDFRLPGAHRASSLHVNIVRVWALGQHAIVSPGEMYLAGCSITFKKK